MHSDEAGLLRSNPNNIRQHSFGVLPFVLLKVRKGRRTQCTAQGYLYWKSVVVAVAGCTAEDSNNQYKDNDDGNNKRTAPVRTGEVSAVKVAAVEAEDNQENKADG